MGDHKLQGTMRRQIAIGLEHPIKTVEGVGSEELRCFQGSVSAQAIQILLILPCLIARYDVVTSIHWLALSRPRISLLGTTPKNQIPSNTGHRLPVVGLRYVPVQNGPIDRRQFLILVQQIDDPADTESVSYT